MQALRAADWVAHHSAVTPDRMACIDVASGRQLTYARLHSRISRLAGSLHARLNVGSTDRVLVLSRNDSDVFEIQFACQRRHALFVPLNWRLTLEELRLIAHDARARVLFYGAEFAQAAHQLADEGLVPVLVEMKAGQPSDYEDLLDSASTDGCQGGPGLENVWALLYTSGTTGTPKGAQFTYCMALCNAMALSSAFGITADSVNLVVLPTFHTGGLNVFANPVFFQGGTNIVVREFDPDGVLSLMTKPENQPTHMLAVPTMHEMLSAQPSFHLLSAGALEGLAVAGAPCPVELIERYAECGLSLRQCWGMTEAGPLALIMPRSIPAAKLSSCGLPNMFADTAIVDRNGSLVSDGQVGELVIRGPVVTSGYWRRPAASEESFLRGGWFRTGDAAYRDSDGYHFIVDRWKDMFISGGENVYPAEIERVLYSVDGVLECAVVGVPDDKWGEVGQAYIVTRQTAARDAQKLRECCSMRLARYKIPKQFVFVETLPRNATGKVLKAKLRARADKHSNAFTTSRDDP